MLDDTNSRNSSTFNARRKTKPVALLLQPEKDERNETKKSTTPNEPGSKLLVLGMVIQPLIGNPYTGYINPYYWVDDHPLLYGTIGSLDPTPNGFNTVAKSDTLRDQLT